MRTQIEITLALLTIVGVLAVLAERIAVPYAILLVIAGLTFSLIPGLPSFVLDPDLVLLVFLPPLVTGAAWYVPWQTFRGHLGLVLILAIGLVSVTMLVVALTAHVIAGLAWAPAFVLGALVSPTDPIAAAAVFRRLHVPDRVATLLESESLVNDATGLVAYRFATAAVLSGTFSGNAAVGQFIYVVVAGIAVGYGAGWIQGHVHRRLDHASVEITLSVLMSYTGYLVAEHIGGSGVLAAMTIGLYARYMHHDILSARVRLEATVLWDTLIFLFNGLVFILLGLQLRAIMATVPSGNFLDVAYKAAAVAAAVILVRIFWFSIAQGIERHFLPNREPSRNFTAPEAALLAWSGMRGVLSLAMAMALPLAMPSGSPFPARGAIIFSAFVVILATLVIQGLSLPYVIRWLNVRSSPADRSQRQLRLVTAQAGLDRLEELVAQDERLADNEMVSVLRARYASRVRRFSRSADAADLNTCVDDEGIEGYFQLRREVLAAERDAIHNHRSARTFPENALLRAERELDLEESRLK